MRKWEKQKKILKHDDKISSPTISLEAIIGTPLICASESCNVAIFDVPGKNATREEVIIGV